MDNQTLQALIEKVATEVGCPTTCVSLSFQDFGPEDGGFSWICETAVKGEPRRKKTYRPPFLGDGDSPEGAAESLLAGDRFRQWKDPEGFQAEKDRATKLANLKAWLADGTLTQDEHDKMVAGLEQS